MILQKTKMMYAGKRNMQITDRRNQRVKDILGVVLFVAAVFVGAWLINLFVFRSFNVDGPSMENTLHTGDRLIVNRLPVSWSHLRGNAYSPERGQVIVFKNPHWQPGRSDEYIVKRVIAYGGERVVLKNGVLKVHNSEYPDGFEVDAAYPGALLPTDGEVDTTVPDGEIFVAGDHRQAGYSFDSRNGLGTIPLEDIVGPVLFRVYPFTKVEVF